MSFIAGDEDSAKFEWVFGRFKHFLEKAPEVFMTDSCQKMNCAINLQFPAPSTVHLLCIWHISKNFCTNIKSIISNADFQVAIRKFWKLAKKTDARSHGSFDSEFADLVQFITDSATRIDMHLRNSKDLQKAINWLETDVYEKKNQWAYRYTFQYFTAGCQSTQRAESIHSVIKRVINRANFSFVRLLAVLEQYCKDREFDRECKANILSIKPPKNHGSTMANAVHKLLTPYAYNKFAIQYDQEGFYSVEKTTDGWLVQRNEEVADTSEELSFEELGSGEIDEGLDDADSSRTIWFVSNYGSCPCQYKTATGIPHTSYALYTLYTLYISYT